MITADLMDFINRLLNSGINLHTVNGQLKITGPKGILSPELLKELKNRKEAILEFLAGIHPRETIPPVEEREYFALSSAQKRLYILQQMMLESTVYNLPQVISLEEVMDKGKLDRVLGQLIHRHESFRTSFQTVQEEPVQKIHRRVDCEIDCFDAAGTDQIIVIIDSFIKPFDLTRAPLLRVGLIKYKGGKHLLVVDMHHIISDGVSIAILVREMTSLFRGEKLEALSTRYKDYAQWQNSEIVREILKKQETYWLKEFPADFPVLNLPTDFSRPRSQRFEGGYIAFTLDKEETRGLREMVIHWHATIYMGLLSLFIILLSKLSGQEDIVIGSPIAGRRHADLEPICGMFVNTLAMRSCPVGHKSIDGFLQEIKRMTLDAFENQDYQFENLVEKVVVHRDASRNPVFDVMFVWQNLEGPLDNMFAAAEGDVPGVPGVPAPPPPGTGEHEQEPKEYEYEHRTSKFDLSLGAREIGDQIVMGFEYCTRLFKPGTIRRWVTCLKRILASVAENPRQRISEIEIITGTEKRRILYDFNDTATGYPADKSIVQLFARQAQKKPDHIAVTGPSVQGHPCLSLSNRQLHEQSDQLGAYLLRKGVKPEEAVGIMVEPSVEMIVGLLAILKAGGTYLPLPPGCPQERKRFILADSGANILLSTTNLSASLENLSWANGTLLMVYEISPDRQRLNSSLAEASSHPRPELAPAASLAYIIYTSGSTGSPKGVMVEHRNVVRLVKNTNYIQFTERDRLLQTGALEFDASTFEIWGTLLNGLVLCLVGKETLLSPEKLKAALRRYEIGILWMTAPLFNHMVDADLDIFQGLRNLLVGGDVLSPSHIHRVKRRFSYLRISNGYGPTENTTFSTTFSIDREYERNIPIGAPIANSTAYILDRYDHLVPLGVIGELVVGGDGVSRGYLNNPELTGEKFLMIPSDWSDRSDRSDNSYLTKKIYKTGDLVRWLPDGNIEFLGRRDSQVKIRGFRVELEEIQGRLIRHPLVKEAVVIAREGEMKEKILCAYMVYHPSLPFSPGSTDPTAAARVLELREFLSQSLPDYMIPSYFIRLEKIPLTANGKIDRKALPPAEFEAAAGYTAPANEIEATLTAIWAELLSLDKDTIDTGADFFQLGGHSLKATLLTARIHKQLKVSVPLIEIFKRPTIKQIARYIKEIGEESAPGRDDHLVLLRKESASGPHLFLLHDGTGEVGGYIDFCHDLQSEFNCWGIRADGVSGESPQNQTIQVIAGSYIEKVRKMQSHGPYYLGGWSLGGTIAFEMAIQLEQAGEKIAFLALIDTPGPDRGLKWARQPNTIPTLIKARSHYVPGAKLKTALYFFKASQSTARSLKRWKDYCHYPIHFYEIPGNHFSIFQKETVARTASIIEKVLLHTYKKEVLFRRNR